LILSVFPVFWLLGFGKMSAHSHAPRVMGVIALPLQKGVAFGEIGRQVADNEPIILPEEDKIRTYTGVRAHKGWTS
jgi:hypothetical protein